LINWDFKKKNKFVIFASKFPGATTNYLGIMTTCHPGFIKPCNTRYVYSTIFQGNATIGTKKCLVWNGKHVTSHFLTVYQL